MLVPSTEITHVTTFSRVPAYVTRESIQRYSVAWGLFTYVLLPCKYSFATCFFVLSNILEAFHVSAFRFHAL